MLKLSITHLGAENSVKKIIDSSTNMIASSGTGYPDFCYNNIQISVTILCYVFSSLVEHIQSCWLGDHVYLTLVY